MTDPISPELLTLLADPDTGEPLDCRDDALVAGASGTSYPVVDGIPRLLPAGFDASHLDEEQALAQMMGREDCSSRR